VDNSDDFVFDNQVVAQALLMKARIGEISCPTRYFPEASSINFRRSVKYGFGVVWTTFACCLARHWPAAWYPFLPNAATVKIAQRRLAESVPRPAPLPVVEGGK
jgi:hypothetical protein